VAAHIAHLEHRRAAARCAGINKLRDLYATGMLENTRAGLGAMATTPGRDVPELVRILSGYNQRAAANARPPIAPYAGTLARVLGANAINRAAQPDDQGKRGP